MAARVSCFVVAHHCQENWELALVTLHLAVA